MNNKIHIKHYLVLIIMIGIIALLAFNLEKSEFNVITKIEISGNKFLNETEYLNYARLDKKDELINLTISVIRDRLEKHPYIKNIDLQIIERGIAQVQIFEKKMDAVLISKNNQYLISSKSEIIPWLSSTKNINLPVIIDYLNNEKIKVFDSAISNDNLFSALKIITTAEIYDLNLYKSISEINLNDKKNISVHLSDLTSPIYFGRNNEIEKTVFLSKIYNHIKGNKINNYLTYVDLRYNEMVYLGLDEILIRDEEKI